MLYIVGRLSIDMKKFCYWQEHTDYGYQKSLDCTAHINEEDIFECPYTLADVKVKGKKLYIPNCPDFGLMIGSLKDLKEIYRKVIK